MTFHRHFIQSGDFCTLIFYPSAQLFAAKDYQESPKLQFYAAYLPKFWIRLLNTRINGFLVAFQEIFGWVFLKRSWIDRAKDFQPDVVFTVAGSWDWTPLAAQRLAKILRVPLVASFNDWYDYGSFRAFPFFRPYIRSKFFSLYQACELALCTSPGMLTALGGGSHAHVLYPTGADLLPDSGEYIPVLPSPSRPLKILFGGSLGDWYGPMLESLIGIYAQQSDLNIEFQIFGANPTWSDQFHQFSIKKNIYKGLVPFEQLVDHASRCDVLLLMMGFDERARVVESTSFKTKFLDYLIFRRPILVWGPSYCTAVSVAREYDSAEIVVDPSPNVCLDKLSSLGSNLDRRHQLIGNSKKMLDGDFHPSVIHQGLKFRLENLIHSRFMPSD